MRVTPVYSGPNNTIEPDVIVGYSFLCPGCKTYHEFTTNLKFRPEGIWDFNGDLNLPSFSPSLLVNKNHQVAGVMECHSWVTDRKIKFYDNCDHDLKGKTVDLLDTKID